MKIFRNSPCPCGSGKKYKRCCGADLQSYGESEQGIDWSQQLSHSIQSSGASTLEEMNLIAQKMNQQRNARPIKEFLGLSPTQMSSMLYSPFDSPALVTFNKDWFPEQAPAMQLFDSLVDGIGREGVKATGQGNLPIHLCRDILVSTTDKTKLSAPRIRSEVEFDELHTVRIVSGLAGLIKHRKSRFYLTKKGQELIQPAHRGRLFDTLLTCYVKNFNWAYRDAYPDAGIIQTAWLFSLYCLSVFGQTWRPFDFYAEYFMHAFPDSIDEMEESTYFSPEQQLKSCYSIRTLDRLARFWGLVTVRPITSSKAYPLQYELRAPQLSQWLHFKR
jgi:hypothetical protein